MNEKKYTCYTNLDQLKKYYAKKAHNKLLIGPITGSHGPSYAYKKIDTINTWVINELQKSNSVLQIRRKP